MSRHWPYFDEGYIGLLDLADLINFNSPLKDAQSEILKATMAVFKAESGQFCLHDSNTCTPDKNKTALVNLSWKYTDQYIKYYHELDPFIKIMPEVSACRDIDIMPRPAWQNHEFNCDFIQPQKIRHLLVIHLRNTREIVGHIGVHRYDPAASFSRKDLFKARFLSTLFSRNLIQRQLVQRLTSLDHLLKQIMVIPSTGIIVLDSSLHPVYWNTKNLELDFSYINWQRKADFTDWSCPVVPHEIIDQCRQIQNSMRKKPGLICHNRRMVIWIDPDQHLEVEIVVLQPEQGDDETTSPFYFVLVLDKADKTKSNLSQAWTSSERLTPKETEIAQYICQGLTNREIGNKLYISLPTVATHVQHIFQKLDVKNRSKLVHKMFFIEDRGNSF